MIMTDDQVEIRNMEEAGIVKAHRAGPPVDRAYLNRLQRSQDEAIARHTRPGGPAAEPLFVNTRPRADRYVYVLLRDLTTIDAEAGRVGSEWYERNRDTLTVNAGSDWINRLKAKIADIKRNPTRANAETTPVPNKANVWTEWRRLASQLTEMGSQHGARFAVATEDGATNKLAFWWIVRHTDDRGMVKYFLRQFIGGQGPVRVRMSPEAMIGVARKIMDTGPKAAMLLFGQELGSCGHCGRMLTNDESRARGIGPVCAAKKGW